ncbi:MAG: hypothetical protein K2X39_05380, partial [Silvanigrellaceae bacterium]|nr:hypothetical protein [Silvanigrellaceae bacterium]
PDALVIFTHKNNWESQTQLKKILTQFNSKKIPCICISMNPHRGDSGKAAQSGFKAYLSMPFEISYLENIIAIVTDEQFQNNEKNELVTKYSIYDSKNISHTKILIAAFTEEQKLQIIPLLHNLNSMNFKFSVTHKTEDFTRQLSLYEFNCIAVPDSIPINLKRQIRLLIKNKKIFYYKDNFVTPYNKNPDKLLNLERLEHLEDKEELAFILKKIKVLYHAGESSFLSQKIS